ncbi:hypothetical protein GN956_G518 [Arapaima gigas]
METCTAIVDGRTVRSADAGDTQLEKLAKLQQPTAEKEHKNPHSDPPWPPSPLPSVTACGTPTASMTAAVRRSSSDSAVS